MTRPVVRQPGPAFRPVGELAERCGHYCWVEHRLFALTGGWATAPIATGIEAEVRVLFSEMSSWHGFVAGQWRDRLPVRAGVNADELIIPTSGPLPQALDLLEGELSEGDAHSSQRALIGLMQQILPALLAAYDEDFARASLVCEAPVKALLGLIRPRMHHEMAQGRALVTP